MKKEEFIAKHVNELSGFLLEAFMVRVSEDEAKVKCPGFSAARKGEFMIEQMKRAREMLAKFYADLETPRSLEEVKADAKLLAPDDRIKLRTWIETQPKSSSNGAKP